MDSHQFVPNNKRAKCAICGKVWDHHLTPPEPKPIPILPLLTPVVEPKPPEPNQKMRATGKFRATNEILLNEIVSLVFPEGKAVANSDELTLRLHLVLGLLRKYGFGPESKIYNY